MEIPESSLSKPHYVFARMEMLHLAEVGMADNLHTIYNDFSVVGETKNSMKEVVNSIFSVVDEEGINAAIKWIKSDVKKTFVDKNITDFFIDTVKKYQKLSNVYSKMSFNQGLERLRNLGIKVE